MQVQTLHAPKHPVQVASAPDLGRMFRPDSVAVIGASPKEGSARNRLLKVLLKHGYVGRVYPVTPSNDHVEGLKAYRSVTDLPEVPDIALIITPAATVPAIIEECGRKGIRFALVFSAGFEEIENGKEYARQLHEAATRHDVVVLGPNCQGIWSVAARAMMTFSAASFDLERIDHSPIAIISQSGALSGAIGKYLQANRLGCSYVVSVGNETCLDALDVLEWMIRQDDVRVVALYLEGLNRAERFIPIAAEARARGVRIVALKAGRSTVGQAATASHTGKIASPYAIYVDVLEQAGVLVAESLAEALGAVEALCYLSSPRRSTAPLGGVAILSSSGGASALLADHADANGVRMATFRDSTIDQLERTLPEFARKENPIDLTGQIRGNPRLFPDTLSVLLRDDRTEAVVIQFASSGASDLVDHGEAFKAVARDGAMPLIVSLAGGQIEPELRREFLDAGVMVSDDPSSAMRALRWLYDRGCWPNLGDLPPPPVLERRSPPDTWAETMSFLDACGVPPARWTLLGPSDRAADACADIQFPLVVKALPSDAEHKTELGLVRLRMATAQDVDRHAADLRHIMGKPDATLLVQEMITDGIEVVLSCLRDTDFGPVLSIGMGGVAIELFRDVAYLALPVTGAQVETTLSKLKLWSLLNGFRGAPKADISALVQAAVDFGNAMLSTPDLIEAEINPVLVRPEGKGIAAVDFLGTVVLRPEQETVHHG